MTYEVIQGWTTSIDTHKIHFLRSDLSWVMTFLNFKFIFLFMLNFEMGIMEILYSSFIGIVIILHFKNFTLLL